MKRMTEQEQFYTRVNDKHRRKCARKDARRLWWLRNKDSVFYTGVGIITIPCILVLLSGWMFQVGKWIDKKSHPEDWNRTVVKSITEIRYVYPSNARSFVITNNSGSDKIIWFPESEIKP